MKKFLLLLAVATLTAGNTFAQYKPTAGSLSTEIQFNPFDQDGHTFKLDGLKLRYFITDNDALRLKLGFSLGHNNSVIEDQSPKDDTTEKWWYKDEMHSTVGNISLNLGYERHFNVSKRISIYVGASIGFDRHFVSSDLEHNQIRSSVYDNWQTHATSYSAKFTNGSFNMNENGIGEIHDRAYWAINADIFTGIDFYVYKGLYVGAELGLSINSLKYSEMKFKGEMKPSEEGGSIEFKSNDDKRETNVKIDVQPALRLGWTF